MTEPKLSADDRFEILDLLGKLYWALDTGDAEGLVALFAPDGVMTRGGGERFEGTERLREFAAHSTANEGTRGRQHVGKPLYFYPSDDGWTVRSYLQIFYCDPETGEKRLRTMSSSDDTCVKTDKGWRIKERHNRSWSGDTLPWVGADPESLRGKKF